MYRGSAEEVKLNDEGELLCSACRSPNLHHGAVTVWDREEDAEQVTVAVVDQGTATVRSVSNLVTPNPSLRRGGVGVEMTCEDCSERHELTFAQHKGVTEMAWRMMAARR